MKKHVLLLAVILAAVATGGCKKVTEPVTEAVTLSVAPSAAITYEAAGGTTLITVTTNQPSWKAESDQDWCKVKELDEKSFSITAEENTSKEPMPEATVTVTAGPAGSAKTATIKVNQKAAAVVPEEKPFTIEVTNITPTSADMKVIPLHTDATYYYDILSAALLKEHHSSDLSVYMKNMVAEAVGMYGSMEEALAKICDTGIQEHSFTRFAPNTDYVAFAAGLDGEGNVNTDIVSTEFRTGETSSDITFEVNFSNFYYDGVDYTLTPSDEEYSYYVTIRPAFQYDELTDDELRAKIMEEDGFMIDFMAQTGVYEYENEGVWCTGTGYIVVVFGYSGGVATSGITKFPFRTLPSDIPPAECTFSVTVDGLTSRSANVSVVPSDAKAEFMWDLIADADYQHYKDDMKKYVTDYVAADITQLDYNRERGETGNMFSKVLTPGTTYYVWTACIDEFGKPAADVIISEPFTTMPDKVSTAAVEATIGKYFDGDELAELDPGKYSVGKGQAYVQVEFKANEDASLWYGNMVKEDPEDPTSAISDSEIADVLVTNGTWCPTGKLYWCEWDSEYTVLAVALGKDDNRGPVLRITRTFTKDGASPISEFVEPTSVQVPVYKAPPFAYSASVKTFIDRKGTR